METSICWLNYTQLLHSSLTLDEDHKSAAMGGVLCTPSRNTFKCKKCVRVRPFHELVKLQCKHKLCTFCVHDILVRHDFTKWHDHPAGPSCTLCQCPFLFEGSSTKDLAIASVIIQQFILWRREQPSFDLSFYGFCENEICPKRYLVNRKCNCSRKSRYVYLHSIKHIWRYM